MDNTSLGPTPECIRILGLPIAPPATITSLFTLTVFRTPAELVAYSTAVATRPLGFVTVPLKIILVTVALGRMARFGRGGSGSIYAERE